MIAQNKAVPAGEDQILALGLGGGNETRARGLVSAGAGIAKRLLEWGYAGFASGSGSAALMSTTERAGFLHLTLESCKVLLNRITKAG